MFGLLLLATALTSWLDGPLTGSLIGAALMAVANWKVYADVARRYHAESSGAALSALLITVGLDGALLAMAVLIGITLRKLIPI